MRYSTSLTETGCRTARECRQDRRQQPSVLSISYSAPVSPSTGIWPEHGEIELDRRWGSLHRRHLGFLLALILLGCSRPAPATERPGEAATPPVQATAPESGPKRAGMQRIGSFYMDLHEVTIGQYRAFVNATGYKSVAEKEGGGHEWDGGWARRPGWTWETPFGVPAADEEPAVHLSWAEAVAYCQWAGKRLPSDAEWIKAAYTEMREHPPAPFVRGQTYRYPTGDSPSGANVCDKNCENGWRDASYNDGFARHAPAQKTRQGVNGLWDMGGNVWEWVQDGSGNERGTRGGSWWYGADKMLAEPTATKPANFYAVYVGFRCAAGN